MSSSSISLFVDGGIIGKNPSLDGGTWAWCQVENDAVVRRKQSGVIMPAEVGLPTVSNNYTELLAAVLGMESLPDGWEGQIFTDSNVTRCRLVGKSPSFKGIPDAMAQRTMLARKRLGAFSVVLLGGHPSKADLIRGTRKDGMPVSRWNQLCDRLCGEAAANWRACQALTATATGNPSRR